MAAGKTLAAERGAWICFQDEAGHTLRPSKARTWAPRGKTPAILVSGKGWLKRIQYRLDLLTSFLTHTGLTLDLRPPQS